MNETYLHWPDLKFTKWCESTFSINRGVYNIIDERLYNKGLHNIVKRRLAIVQFLEQNVQQTPERKFYKFGQGNLSEALIQFESTLHIKK